MKFEFSIDRGGTFTDVLCCIYHSNSEKSSISKDKIICIDRLKLLVIQ